MPSFIINLISLGQAFANQAISSDFDLAAQARILLERDF